MQKTMVIVSDDINGEEGAETIRFGAFGKQYEIDLSPKHQAELQEALGKFLRSAREIKSDPARPRVRGRRGSSNGHDPAEVRRWARDNGVAVNSRGRISGEVLGAYRSASS